MLVRSSAMVVATLLVGFSGAGLADHPRYKFSVFA